MVSPAAFATFQPFTLRARMRGDTAAVAALLDVCGKDELPPGSVLAELMLEDGWDRRPRMQFLDRGIVVFELTVQTDQTAEEQYSRLVRELQPLGFEEAGP